MSAVAPSFLTLPTNRDEALAALVRLYADESDRRGRAAAPVVEALASAGVAEMCLPVDLGGDAATLLECMDLYETVAEADASAGWVTVAASALPMFTRTLADEQRNAIFARKPSFAAGAVTPAGRAEEVAGGFNLSGKWQFLTGCHHSSWIYVQAFVYRDGEPATTESGGPELRVLFLPAEQVGILDTWHVAGMRATGSNHARIDGQFVAREMSYAATDPIVLPGTFFRMPPPAHGAASLAAIALGNARHAFKEFVRLATERGPMGSTTPNRERTVVQVAAAESEALHTSARLFLRQAVQEMWNTLASGMELAMGQRAAVRLAAAHAVASSVRIADLAFHNAGSSSVFEESHLERAWRDAHVIAQNAAGSAASFETMGRVILGLEPNSPFI